MGLWRDRKSTLGISTIFVLELKLFEDFGYRYDNSETENWMASETSVHSLTLCIIYKMSKGKYQATNACFLQFCDGFGFVLQSWRDFDLILKIDSKVREQNVCAIDVCDVFDCLLRNSKKRSLFLFVHSLFCFTYFAVLFVLTSLFALSNFHRSPLHCSLYFIIYELINPCKITSVQFFSFRLRPARGVWFPDLGMRWLWFETTEVNLKRRLCCLITQKTRLWQDYTGNWLERKHKFSNICVV